MTLDEALDELYAVPLSEFTAKRNELAKQLGADGSELKALKKPNVAAWAVNQLVRLRGDDIDELFATTDKLRLAQRRVLSGGKPSELRTATDERNRLVARLTSLAEKILADAGHGAATSTMSAITDSLVAIASDVDGAELLRNGRLTKELERGAFVDVGGLSLVPADKTPTNDEAAPDLSALFAAREVVTAAREALKIARDAAKEAVTEQRRLDKEFQEAERKAKVAHESAEFARRSAEARQADVEEAEKTLAAAQKELKALE